LFKDFNVKRLFQTKQANTYDKLIGSDRVEKVKELQADLASQQQFFTRACESKDNITKASCKAAMLIAKHCISFTEGTFITVCVMKMVENIFPEKKQSL
jgi:hypothetical protein